MGKLVIRIFDRRAGLVASTFPENQFFDFLRAQSSFGDDSVLRRWETVNVHAVLDLRAPKLAYFSDCLCTSFFPIGSEHVGAVGYVFDRYPSPEDCHKMARLSGFETAALWRILRHQVPATDAKIQGFATLLKTVAEAQIAELQARISLIAADASKNEFLSLVSHELKTPLTSAMMCLDLMSRQGKLAPERSADYLRRMRNALGAQERIINDLLDVARITSGKLHVERKPVDVRDVLHESAAMLEPLAREKGLDFQISIPSRPLIVLADAPRLRQAFCNLLNNAIKFTHAGEIRLEVKIKGPVIRVYVRDTGIGMEESLLPRLFTKFSQAQIGQPGLHQRGIGLGLYLCDQILKLHRGRISIASDGPMRGTTVLVDLPIAPA